MRKPRRPRTLESLRLEGKLPSLAELRAYVELSGYSNAAWKFRMKEGWVRQLLDEQPGPKLSAELLPVSRSEVASSGPLPAADVSMPRILARSTTPGSVQVAKPPVRYAQPAVPSLPPSKPAELVSAQERVQVVAALTASGRPVSKSLLLCRLRGWKVERLELTLTALLAANAIYSPDTGRYGVNP